MAAWLIVCPYLFLVSLERVPCYIPSNVPTARSTSPPWAARAEHICHERGCTRCGLGRTTPLPAGFEPDRLADADCPRCFFPFREVWDEHEAYHWQEGNDLRCCDCA